MPTQGEEGERERERERENPDRSRNHLTRYLLPRSPVLVGQRGKRQGAIFGIYTLSYSSCMCDGLIVSAIYPAIDLSAVPHCLMLTPKLLAPGCLVKVRSGRLFHSSCSIPGSKPQQTDGTLRLAVHVVINCEGGATTRKTGIGLCLILPITCQQKTKRQERTSKYGKYKFRP